MSILSALGMALLYNFSEIDSGRLDGVHPEDTWNFSRLDKLTLAAMLDLKHAVWGSILLMYLFTALAYWFLLDFSGKMSEFEFYSSNAFIDNFVANHSLIITGVNEKLSP